MNKYKPYYQTKDKIEFEIGKSYEINEKDEFIYFENIDDIFYLYQYKNNLIIFEIEILNEKDKTDEKDKTIFLFKRIIPKEEYNLLFKFHEFQFNDNNTIIEHKKFQHFQFHHIYDEKGNLIYYEDSKNNKSWLSYDINNNLINYKNSIGFEYWNTYDENNNLIYYEDINSFGEKTWISYKENKKMEYYKNSKDNIKKYLNI